MATVYQLSAINQKKKNAIKQKNFYAIPALVKAPLHDKKWQ